MTDDGWRQCRSCRRYKDDLRKFGEARANERLQKRIKRESAYVDARENHDTEAESFCIGCKAWLPKADFVRNKARKNGCHSYCKVCMARNQANRESDPVYRLFANCKSRESTTKATGRNIKVLITKDDVLELWNKQNGHCCITGLKFDTSFTTKKSPLAPSLDRIDSSKDYETGNIRIVCHALNIAMNAWGLDQLLYLASTAIKHLSYEPPTYSIAS